MSISYYSASSVLSCFLDITFFLCSIRLGILPLGLAPAPSAVARNGAEQCRDIFWQWSNFTFDLKFKKKMKFSCPSTWNYSVQIFHRTRCTWKTSWGDTLENWWES